jgi:hypothetical protein
VLLDREVQPLQPVERVGHLVGLDLYEEPEVAEVDAEHRHRPPRHQPQRAEHRAVAAEADDSIRSLGQLRVGHDRRVAVPARGVMGSHQQTTAVQGRPIADGVEHRAGVPARVQDERDLGCAGHAQQATGESATPYSRSIRASRAVEIEATAEVDQRRLAMTFSLMGMIRTPTKLAVRGRLVQD